MYNFRKVYTDNCNNKTTIEMTTRLRIFINKSQTLETTVNNTKKLTEDLKTLQTEISNITTTNNKEQTVKSQLYNWTVESLKYLDSIKTVEPTPVTYATSNYYSKYVNDTRDNIKWFDIFNSDKYVQLSTKRISTVAWIVGNRKTYNRLIGQLNITKEQIPTFEDALDRYLHYVSR